MKDMFNNEINFGDQVIVSNNGENWYKHTLAQPEEWLIDDIDLMIVYIENEYPNSYYDYDTGIFHNCYGKPIKKSIVDKMQEVVRAELADYPNGYFTEGVGEVMCIEGRLSTIIPDRWQYCIQFHYASTMRIHELSKLLNDRAFFI